MILLPPKRKRARAGIERAVRREWPRHRKWVRAHGCCVPECQNLPVDFAHVRSAANAGTGLKPHDWWAVSLCREHHSQSHQIGVVSFQKLHDIDLWKMAQEFSRLSPDFEMKQAMRDEGAVNAEEMAE